MARRYKIHVSLIIGLSLLAACHSHSETFEFKRTEHGILITENDIPVLFYRSRSDSVPNHPSRNNYIHPLFTFSGDTLTEDFPADHMHHRGVFWAWHQIWVGDKWMGDSWVYDNFQWEITNIDIETQDDKALLALNSLWKTPLLKNASGAMIPLAEEKVHITVLPADDRARMLLFDLEIVSMVDSLSVGGSGDFKGYGGFSWRVRLPEHVLFAGTGGIVTPQKNAVQAGPWINMYERDEQSSVDGLLVISHPDNPGNPDRWILRNKQSMQNAVFPGRYPLVINEGEGFRLRYCMVVYEGNPQDFSPREYYIKYLSAI